MTPASSYWTMRRQLVERFSAEIVSDAKAIFLLAESHTVHAVRSESLAAPRMPLLAHLLVGNPIRTAAAVLRRLKSTLRRRLPLGVGKLLSRDLLPKKA